jgi:hypothetical protein
MKDEMEKESVELHEQAQAAKYDQSSSRDEPRSDDKDDKNDKERLVLLAESQEGVLSRLQTAAAQTADETAETQLSGDVDQERPVNSPPVPPPAPNLILGLSLSSRIRHWDARLEGGNNKKKVDFSPGAGLVREPSEQKAQSEYTSSTPCAAKKGSSTKVGGGTYMDVQLPHELVSDYINI